MYAKIRKVVAYTATGLVGIILVAILGEIAINAGVESGLITDTPLKDAAQAMSSILGWPYWTQLIWFIIGVASWSWIDFGLRKIFAPSMLRQLIDEQIYDNALEMTIFKVVRCDELDGNKVRLTCSATIVNHTGYGIYMKIGTPFFAIQNRANQHFTLEEHPLFIRPNESYEMFIPPISDIEVVPNISGRLKILLSFGLEESKFDKQLSIDAGLALDWKRENGELHWNVPMAMSDKITEIPS